MKYDRLPLFRLWEMFLLLFFFSSVVIRCLFSKICYTFCILYALRLTCSSQVILCQWHGLNYAEMFIFIHSYLLLNTFEIFRLYSFVCVLFISKKKICFSPAMLCWLPVWNVCNFTFLIIQSIARFFLC